MNDWVDMVAGKVLNYAGVSVLTPAEMSASARRVLRFIDLGGHEKYLKTALYGMTCMVCLATISDRNNATARHPQNHQTAQPSGLQGKLEV